MRASLVIVALAGVLAMPAVAGDGADTTPAARAIRVVVFGDSITKGVRTGVRAEDTFAALSERALNDEGIPVEFINLGVGGERTDQALDRLDAVAEYRPRLVTVMYGTNDSYVDRGATASRISAAEYRANLEAIVAGLLLRGIEPILMTEPRWADDAPANGLGEDPNVRLAPYMEACRAVAAECRVPLVDHFARWTRARAKGQALGEWTTDGCHPNPRGHRELADAMRPALRAALRPAPRPVGFTARLETILARDDGLRHRSPHVMAQGDPPPLSTIHVTDRVLDLATPPRNTERISEMPIIRPSWPILGAAAFLMSTAALEGRAAELLVGGASVSITPDRPVALAGQMHTRVASQVESPVTATALALESRDGGKVVDQAILVSCDLVAIEAAVLDRVRQRVGERIPGLDRKKVVLNATHTHTAPVTTEGDYLIPKDGVVQPAEYAEFLSSRITDAAVRAWESRRPGRVGWGLGHAVVAQNRRSIYSDGRAQMYGPTDRPDFRGIEGSEDQGVEVLFFWDGAGKLLATAVNVACPSQEVEGGSAVNADFWHDVRESLRSRHGKDLLVLAWTGAAGDQSPHLMYRKRAEERMRTLRGLSRLQELSRRVVAAWEEAYDGARKEPHSNVVMAHRVAAIELPAREVTDAEAAEARSKVESLSRDPRNRRLVVWHGDVVKRHEQQKAGTARPFGMELHVIRLGDVAIATNVFELFTEFGIQIKSRSRALQTFVIQLAGPGSYLPTARAARGGGYSAIVESNLVGPEGGQVLADRTVELINSLWTEKE